MTQINHSEIDDEDAGEENQSGVGLNTALPPDPQRASGAFAAGPELGDANTGRAADSTQPPEKKKQDETFIDPDAQTDVNTDPHHHPPILPKSDKEQP